MAILHRPPFSAWDRSATGNDNRVRLLVLAAVVRVLTFFILGAALAVFLTLSSPTTPSVNSAVKESNYERPGVPDVAVNDSNQTTNRNFPGAAMTPRPPRRTNSSKLGSRMVLDKRSCQLPVHTKSQHYDLSLIWNLDRNTYDGLVKIGITVREQTDFIMLHSKNLNIAGTQLYRIMPNHTEEPVELEKSYSYIRCQFFVEEAKDIINPGEYRLIMSFSPMLENRIVGLGNYASKISAREVYPCLDEPQLKATYRIKLVFPDDKHYNFDDNNLKRTKQALFFVSKMFH